VKRTGKQTKKARSPRVQVQTERVLGVLNRGRVVLELSREELGDLMQASSRTVTRWRGFAHQPQPRHRARAEILIALLDRWDAAAAGDRWQLHRWLLAPHAALDGQQPRAVLLGPDLAALQALTDPADLPRPA